MPKSTKRLAIGRSFAGGTAVIIMRDTGQVINKATILEKSFRIDTPDLGELEIKTDAIKTIVYKNMPSYPTDMIRTLNSSELNGSVLNDPIRIDAEDLGGKAGLARSRILSIIW
jgi:hypothetical protein